jgi:hypothetical protein
MIKKIMSLLGLGLFVLICYIAFMLLMPYYKEWKYESDARDIVRFDIREPEEMRDKLLSKGREMDIPVLENAIIVYRTYEGPYVAKISWTEVVDIFGYYQKSYKFQFEVGGKELGRNR